MFRSDASAGTVIPHLHDIARQMDARVSVPGIREMSEIVAGAAAKRHFLMTLLAACALVAPGIAVVGILGMFVSQVPQADR